MSKAKDKWVHANMMLDTEELYDEDDDVYVMMSGKFSYMNHSIENANVKIDGCGNIEALKQIACNAELLWDYGDKYFGCQSSA